MNAIETTNKLDFLSKPWERDPQWSVFKIGTCHGQWRGVDDAYEILSVVNEEPGNGHFEDVLQWFEYACKRDRKNFRILEVWNENLKQHLFKKRGFIFGRGDDMIKYFDK